MARTVTIRLILGMLLIAAAGMKLYGLNTSAMPSVGWFAQPWVQLAAAEWELVLGFWLISGSFAKGSWFAALGTFLTFAGVSASLGIDGAASCGCLGAVHANPWWAFGVDAMAVVLLAIGHPKRVSRTESNWRPLRVGLEWGIIAVVLMLGLSAIGAAVYGTPEAALAHLRGESLTIDEPYLDFGIANPGDEISRIATVRNMTDHPIRILVGTSDCNCTTLKDLPANIEPGKSAAISIDLYTPPSKSGRLTRRVFLRTNDPVQPVVRFSIGCLVE